MSDTFGCAINCVDGRAQLPVIEWVKFHGPVQFVDMITEPGADGVLSGGGQGEEIKNVYRRLATAVRAHNPSIIAIAGHFDCIANPVSFEEHLEQIKRGSEVVSGWASGARVAGLYVNQYGTIDVVHDSKTAYRELRSYL